MACSFDMVKEDITHTEPRGSANSDCCVATLVMEIPASRTKDTHGIDRRRRVIGTAPGAGVGKDVGRRVKGES
jgi:hypothetical protein